MSKDKSIQAFPDDIETGMSLRQWYAGMFMQGMLSKEGMFESVAGNKPAIDILVKFSLDLADAMIAEGKK